MGLFSSIAGRSTKEEPWLANLMDDDTVPLAELEAVTNPFVAPPSEQSDDDNMWGLPDLDLPEPPGSGAPVDVVPPALAGLLDQQGAPPSHSFDAGQFGSFDAAPFSDMATPSVDEQMLSLEPIPHEAAPIHDFSVAHEFSAPSFDAEPLHAEPFHAEPLDAGPVDAPGPANDDEATSSWGHGFGDHLADLPDTFDRRLPANEPSLGFVAPGAVDRHHGPTGDHAPAQLAAFGLEPGASWASLRDRYLELLYGTDCDDGTDSATAAELVAFRRQINTGYASLRLLAAH